MASSTPARPLALVRRITTATLTAAAVGAGLVAIHLAGGQAAASVTSPSNLVAPQGQSPGQPQSSQSGSAQDPGASQGFAPVDPLTGGSMPQGSTRGS
jgi:hypothetical protein